MIEEGVGLRKSLQVALSHKELLRECLGPDLAGKLERDGTKALNETDTQMNDLKRELKVSMTRFFGVMLHIKCLLF